MFTFSKKANTIFTAVACMLLVGSLYNCDFDSTPEVTSQSLFAKYAEYPAQLADAKIGARGSSSALDQKVANLWDQANASYAAGNYTDAVETLKKVEGLDDTFESQSASNFYYALGNAQLKQGNAEAAARSFANVTSGELSEDAVWKRALSMLAVEEQRDNAKIAMGSIASSTHAKSSLAENIMAEMANMPGPPTAVASANLTSGVIPKTITFSAAGTTDPDNNIINYAWNFGDGNTAYGFNVTHTYYTPGVYEVVLVVFDMTGQASQAIVKVAISAPVGVYEMAIPATDDATIQVGTTLNEPTIQAGNNKVSYLKFDIPAELCGTLVKSELELSYEGVTSESGSVLVHKGTHDSWSEGTIDSNNAPDFGELLSQKNKVFNIGDLDRWNINATNSGDKTLLVSTNSSTGNFVFGSSEYYFDDGKPKLVLTIDNNAGACQYSLIEPLYFESECAIIGSNWQKKNIGSASNGKYLLYPGTRQEFNTPPIEMNKMVRFPVLLSEAGDFDVWTRIQVSNNVNNSFWVRVNNGDWYKFSDIPKKPGFKWEQVYDNNNGGQLLTVNLPAGFNFIDVAVMEDGTKLDKLALLAPGSPAPTAKGPSATNCQGGSSSVSSAGQDGIGVERDQVQPADESLNEDPYVANNLTEDVEIYPNPFYNDVTLDMQIPTNNVNVRVFGLDGKLIKEYLDVAGDDKLQVGGELANGNYIVHVDAGNQVFYKKIQKLAE